MTGFALLRVVFYNLRVGRAQWRVAAELRAIALLYRPKVLAGCEAVGYRLPHLPGYVLIRDSSTGGRANLFAYVRANRRLVKVRWHDCRQTWARTEHPGTHPARSYLELIVEGVMLLVGHHPPKTAGGPGSSLAARVEGGSLVLRRLEREEGRGFDTLPRARQQVLRWRPEVALLDWNAAGDEPLSPQRAAEVIGGRVAGDKIDAAVVRNAELRGWRYAKRVLQVLLRTDHPWGCLVVELRVQRAWWPAR